MKWSLQNERVGKGGLECSFCTQVLRKLQIAYVVQKWGSMSSYWTSKTPLRVHGIWNNPGHPALLGFGNALHRSEQRKQGRGPG